MPTTSIRKLRRKAALDEHITARFARCCPSPLRAFLDGRITWINGVHIKTIIYPAAGTAGEVQYGMLPDAGRGELVFPNADRCAEIQSRQKYEGAWSLLSLFVMKRDVMRSVAMAKSYEKES